MCTVHTFAVADTVDAVDVVANTQQYPTCKQDNYFTAQWKEEWEEEEEEVAGAGEAWNTRIHINI